MGPLSSCLTVPTCPRPIHQKPAPCVLHVYPPPTPPTLTPHPALLQLVDLVARILALVPPWVRVYRIQRDIPMPLVTSGVEKGNLRELALARMGHLGLKCRDVRTRECGIQDIHHKVRCRQQRRRRRRWRVGHGGLTQPGQQGVG
jgi:hypothetical protein